MHAVPAATGGLLHRDLLNQREDGTAPGVDRGGRRGTAAVTERDCYSAAGGIQLRCTCRFLLSQDIHSEGD